METPDLCIACHKPLQIGLNICPHCKKVQHQIYQPEGEVKDWTSNPAVRWVYAGIFISIVGFLAVMLWINRGEEGNKSMAQGCAVIKKSGYAGTIKDCMAKMAAPAGN
jgi:hypothetical protein